MRAKRTPVEKTCEACGQSFAKPGNRRFCSMTCRSASATGKCGFIGCENDLHYRGLCSGHAEQRRQGVELKPLVDRTKYPRVCVEDGCDQLAAVRQRCMTHYRRMTRPGKTAQARRGERIGDGNIDVHGYRRLYRPNHPMAGKNGLALEHRMVMSDALDRRLLPTETVHHINGNRQDNRLENLELWVKSHGAGQRVEDVIAHAVDTLKLYASERLA